MAEVLSLVTLWLWGPDLDEWEVKEEGRVLSEQLGGVKVSHTLIDKQI